MALVAERRRPTSAPGTHGRHQQEESKYVGESLTQDTMMAVPHFAVTGESGSGCLDSHNSRKASSDRPACFRILQNVPVGRVPGGIAT